MEGGREGLRWRDSRERQGNPRGRWGRLRWRRRDQAGGRAREAIRGRMAPWSWPGTQQAAAGVGVGGGGGAATRGVVEASRECSDDCSS